MKVYCEIYLDKHMEDKYEEVLDGLEKNKWRLEVYLIALSKNVNNH